MTDATSSATTISIARLAVAAALGVAAMVTAVKIYRPEPPALVVPGCDDHAECSAWRAKARECERWTR